MGVKAFAGAEAAPSTLYIGDQAAAHQGAKLERLRARRPAAAASASLDRLRRDAGTGANTMPSLLACARSSCTLGEICAALREVLGAYTETAVA